MRGGRVRGRRARPPEPAGAGVSAAGARRGRAGARARSGGGPAGGCHNAGMSFPSESIVSSTPAPRRRGPGRPPTGSEDKRERILNEAVALFGARGYAGTSLADVADAADISKAGLLHHFSSKGALFAQVLERRDRQAGSRILREEDREDPWLLLDAFARLVEHNARHRELVAIYTATAVSVLDADHPAHAWMAGHLAGTVEMFERAFERGKEAGTVHPDAPSRLIARTLTALSDGLQIQWLCATTPHTTARESLGTDMAAEVRLYAEGLRRQWRLEPARRESA